MWYLANSLENSFIEKSKLASLQVTALSIVTELINRYLLGSFFLIKNQVFRYNPFKSSKTLLLKQSYIIFITSKTNAQDSKKFGACYALCEIIFKIIEEKTSL